MEYRIKPTKTPPFRLTIYKVQIKIIFFWWTVFQSFLEERAKEKLEELNSKPK